MTNTMHNCLNWLMSFLTNKVINEMKRPTGEHTKRYSSLLCDEVGVLMPNEIVACIIFLTGCDSLQYPMIFSHDTDGWNINLTLANNK